jgi:integrase
MRYGDRPNLVLSYTDPVSGKRKTKSAETANEKDAWKAAAKWEEELRSGQYVSPSKVTWSEFRTRYQAERLATLSAGYLISASTAFNHLERILNPGKLAALTTSAMSKFIATLRAEKMKESTLASQLRNLKAALRWAKRMGLLVTVPTFDMPKAGEAKGRPISGEEFERMLSTVRKVRPHDAEAWERILTGLWLSGLRLGEAVILSWDDDAPFAVDLSGKFPAFRIEAKAQKGRRNERLPLTPDFSTWLLQTPEAERVGRVFKMPSLRGGQPLCADRVGAMIERIGERAGVVVNRDPDTGKVKYATAHDLRRSFGNRWASRVRTPVLQRLMRHANIQTTLKYYVSLDADEVAADLWAKHPVSGNTSGNIAPEKALFAGGNVV